MAGCNQKKESDRFKKIEKVSNGNPFLNLLDPLCDLAKEMDYNENQTDAQNCSEYEKSHRNFQDLCKDVANDPDADPDLRKFALECSNEDSKRATEERINHDNNRLQNNNNIVEIVKNIGYVIIGYISIKTIGSIFTNDNSKQIAQNEDDDTTIYSITDKNQNRHSS